MTQRTRLQWLMVSTLTMLLVCSIAPNVHAQAARGGILGNVADNSGGAVPGVTITITEVRTNLAQTAVTNESGNYTFPNVRDGVYRVEAELSGFKKSVRENVQVDVNTTVRADFHKRRRAALNPM